MCERNRKHAILGLTVLTIFVTTSIVPNSWAGNSGTTGSNIAIAQGVSWLHTSGVYLYDESGQKINLYSMNFHYGGGQGLTLDDIQKVKALGFNAIRLHLYWGLIQPRDESTNGIDVAYFTTGKAPLNHGLDEVVGWAEQENMYFIMNLAWTETWGPPAWAFKGVSDDNQRYAQLITGAASKERTGVINTWAYIASRYQNVPNVIFELLNEPIVSDNSLAGVQYKNFNEQIISGIESTEVKPHVKIIQLLLNDWEEILDTASDVDKPNVMWSTHRYTSNWDPSGRFYHEALVWNGKYFESGWGNGTLYVAWRIIRDALAIHGWNKPWINTELGMDTTVPHWSDWFDLVLKTKTEYDATGWGLWFYCSDVTFIPSWNMKDPATQKSIMSAIIPYVLTGNNNAQHMVGMVSSSSVEGAHPGATVALSIEVRKQLLVHRGSPADAPAPSVTEIWLWVDGPGWQPSHWVAYASNPVSTDDSGLLETYSISWTIPSSSQPGAYTCRALVWYSASHTVTWDWLGPAQAFVVT